MEYEKHIPLFKKLGSKGEETPLDHIPVIDHYHSWFIKAYNLLSRSKNDSSDIPLSELKVYADTFGLIGTFEEFVNIIYAISSTHNKFISEKRKKNAN